MQRFALAKGQSLPASAARAFDVIGREMSLVEAEYERQVSSNIQVVNYLGDYVRSSGGKRIRPALLIMANYAVGGRGDAENVIRLATVMEMLHTATLVHDDIIDNADIRRNRSSVNARFGNQTAVLMGDWLYMSAFETTVKERSLDILDILTRLTRKMTEGELIQLTRIGRIDITEEEYLDILRRKTAFLFSACGEVGAILGGADDERRAALRDFGMELGIAFQLADDLLDLTGETQQLGKAAGSDLIEGKVTLPLIYLLKEYPDVKQDIERIMFDGEYAQVSREDVRQLLASKGVLDGVRTRIAGHAEAARKSLAVLPESEYRSCLETTLQFVMARNS
ncbi:MAG: polyprenyl synthetase family protein [Chloracidobacterium sp.]|nr:polyprenyl synthetase family protein [Chloracidobacterium sp.]